MPWRSLRRCSDRAKVYIRSQLNRLRRVGTVLRAWPPGRTRTSDRTRADAVDRNSSIHGAGCTATRQPPTTATGSTAGTTGSSPAPWGRCHPPVLPVRPRRRRSPDSAARSSSRARDRSSRRPAVSGRAPPARRPPPGGRHSAGTPPLPHTHAELLPSGARRSRCAIGPVQRARRCSGPRPQRRWSRSARTHTPRAAPRS
jgi:hypothetical protein